MRTPIAMVSAAALLFICPRPSSAVDLPARSAPGAPSRPQPAFEATRSSGPRGGASIVGTVGVGVALRAGLQAAPSFGVYTEAFGAWIPVGAPSLLLSSSVVAQLNFRPEWFVSLGGGVATAGSQISGNCIAPSACETWQWRRYGSFLVRAGREYRLQSAGRSIGAFRVSFGVLVLVELAAARAPAVIPLPMLSIGYETY